MSVPESTVFLLDIDNTLFDNDRLQDDLGRRLERALGAANRDRYWATFEALRTELGYADYLGALQRFRLAADPEAMNDPGLLKVSSYLMDYPFAARLYPAALATVAHLGRFGRTVILSDGDVVFQPRKALRSGLWDAVDGRVLLFVHKETALTDVLRRHPARHYVLVDDKRRILAAAKAVLGDRVTTVFVRQGHFALEPHSRAPDPAPDLTVARVGHLLGWDDATLPTLHRALARPTERP